MDKMQSMRSVDVDQMKQTFINMKHDVDAEYLNALYFPETSPPARIPSKFAQPSGLFTQRFNFYQNTGTNGSGLITFCPQDTMFFPVLSSGLVWNEQGLPDVGFDPFSSPLFTTGQDSYQLPNNYTYGRLVGASIRVSWIGPRETESGIIVGSHVFNATPFTLSEDIIEEGYFPVRAAPHEGLRFVYVPKDEKDLQFTPLQRKIVNTNGTQTPFGSAVLPKQYFLNNDNDPEQIEGIVANDNAFSVHQATINDTGSALTWGPADVHNKSISRHYGQMENDGKSENPNMIAIYWKGLPAEQQWFRVDVERHFERQHLRDVVAVQRPLPSPKTIDYVLEAYDSPKLHAHTNTYGKVLESHVKPRVHQLPDASSRNLIKKAETHTEKSFMHDAAAVIGQLVGAEVFGPAGGVIGSALAGLGADSLLDTATNILGTFFGDGGSKPNAYTNPVKTSAAKSDL